MTDYIVVPVMEDFQAQVDTALDQIIADRAVLVGSPTNADLIAVLDNVLDRQSKEVKVLCRMLNQMKRG